jgi:arylsulfatase A-like enzyme
MRISPALTACCIALPLLNAVFPAETRAAAKRPNVVLIITDDQGYGDLGVHGNPKIKTPHIDRLASQSLELTHFHVSPVCSPTRSALMTGRYNYRTGVVDTFQGRSMMHADEVTLAEMLRAGGYQTGIFGKWHLGDNYPLRAIDQGFQEAFVLKGGGIGQPSDPPGGDSYFNPTLWHNGKAEKTSGYVSDVITTAAIEFIGQQRDKPFFVYLPFNCPHSPFDVPDEYYLPYKTMDLSASQFPSVGNPLPVKLPLDDTARAYGMITNIDDNVGRLLSKLDELQLVDDTIVIFMTDNGPPQPRFNSGLRNRKTTVYDGGIRVPCFVRWPGKLKAGAKVEPIAAHIDLAPTLLAACGVEKPSEVKFDGQNLLPLWTGDVKETPERTLYFQWHRGDVPLVNRACAARGVRYKILQPLGVTDSTSRQEPNFELYDMQADPFEQHDLAEQLPEVVAQMRKGYEAWFHDVSSTRGYAPPRIFLGAAQENPVLLTRQDMRASTAGGGPRSLGHWEVEVARAGKFNVKLIFAETKTAGNARLKLGDVALQQPIEIGAKQCVWGGVQFPAGPASLTPEIVQAGDSTGVQYVDVEWIE